jgi:hypothetical protein
MLAPRAIRVLKALCKGPVFREQVDRLAGCSNGPGLIYQLRKRYGLEIPCRRERGLGRDWLFVSRGRYRLSDKDRMLVPKLLDLTRTAKGAEEGLRNRPHSSTSSIRGQSQKRSVQ